MDREYLDVGQALRAGMATDFRRTTSTYGEECAPDTPSSLTGISMTHVHNTNAQLAEINSRLYELRDRLFGPQSSPALRGEAVTKEAPVMGFADAFSRSAQETAHLLGTLDRLTIELANRL